MLILCTLQILSRFFHNLTDYVLLCYLLQTCRLCFYATYYRLCVLQQSFVQHICKHRNCLIILCRFNANLIAFMQRSGTKPTKTRLKFYRNPFKSSKLPSQHSTIKVVCQCNTLRKHSTCLLIFQFKYWNYKSVHFHFGVLRPSVRCLFHVPDLHSADLNLRECIYSRIGQHAFNQSQRIYG